MFADEAERYKQPHTAHPRPAPRGIRAGSPSLLLLHHAGSSFSRLPDSLLKRTSSRTPRMHGYGRPRVLGALLAWPPDHPARCCHHSVAAPFCACLRRLLCAGVGPCWSWLTSSRAQRQMTTSRRSVRACPFTRHTSQPRQTDRHLVFVHHRQAGWCSSSSMCAGCVLEQPAHPPLPCPCCVQAIAKLEQALTIDDKCTDAMWCLGNAYTSLVRSQTSLLDSFTAAAAAADVSSSRIHTC